MPATMPAKSLIDRVWEYAMETGQDPHDVYVALVCQINFARPEVVDAAFARMRATR